MLFRSDPAIYRAHMDWYLEQIVSCTYRQFTTGFFYGKPGPESQIYDSNTYVKEYTYLGFVEEVRDDGLVRITQRNKFLVGEEIGIMKPDGTDLHAVVRRILTEDGTEQESAPHPQQVLYVDLDGQAQKYDILRRREETAAGDA